VADEDQARARADEGADAVEVALALAQVRLEQPNHDAVALHAVEQADVDRHVLVRRGDDLVALLQGQPVDDRVDASVAQPIRARSSLRTTVPAASRGAP